MVTRGTSEVPSVPDEEKVMTHSAHSHPPGDYGPRASSMQDMKSPEFLDKLKKGPVMVCHRSPERTGCG
jgi:hypothetical protein